MEQIKVRTLSKNLQAKFSGALQCVAVCCNVLQRDAVCCILLQYGTGQSQDSLQRYPDICVYINIHIAIYTLYIKMYIYTHVYYIGLD